jgi:hypothetical protein
VRRPARDLILALAVAAGLVGATAAQAQDPDFSHSLRDLDGGQFLEDEPIWICDPAAAARVGHAPRWISAGVTLVGIREGGRQVQAGPLDSLDSPPRTRAGELVRSLNLPLRSDLHPIDVGIWSGGGLPAGSFEVLRGDKTIARFRVIEPRGSELSVRAALARAARLSMSHRAEDVAQAARLYESVLERYPRTSYMTSIYAGLWRVRAHTRAYAADPGAWLDRIFATFHDTCFGVWALDRFMADMPEAESRPLLRRLVGLYPDTKLARAAGAYL